MIVKSVKMGRMLEKDIQRQICDWLAIKQYFFWRNNTIPVFDKGKFRAMPKYALRGLPDIMIIHKGIFIGLEVKSLALARGGNRETKSAQMFVGEKIKENGGIYKVVYSLEDVVDLLTQQML